MSSRHKVATISVLPIDEIHLGEVVGFLRSRGVEAGRSAALRYALAEVARDIRTRAALDVRRAV